MFLLWLRQLPQCGDWTPASLPPPAEGRSSPTYTPIFPPSSFILPSFAWFYILFSAGQVLLSTLSWCSAYISVYEGVFLMPPWRKMYSTSTYSSAILFSEVKVCRRISRTFLVAPWWKICQPMQETQVWSLIRAQFISLARLLMPPGTVTRGFPGDASRKEPTCQCRRHKRHRFDPRVGRIHWDRNGHPLQRYCLGKPVDRGTWQAPVRRVAGLDMTEAAQQAACSLPCCMCHLGVSEVFRQKFKLRFCGSFYLSVYCLLPFPPGKDNDYSKLCI